MSQGITSDIISIFEKFPKTIDGKDAILEMKENKGKNWKQMEWAGFYFEYWCNQNLKNILEMPYSKKYGNVTFDAFFKRPWDFKFHAIEASKWAPINDYEAISTAIDEFGDLGIVLAECSVDYDNERSDFKKWHDSLKGKTTPYVEAAIKRNAPSRRRKTEIKVKRISFINLNRKLLDDACKSFQENFKNSNGKSRRRKVKLDLSKIKDNLEYVIHFS
jgi:hypothetical protein